MIGSRHLAIFVVAAVMSNPAAAADVVLRHAAGSLRGALSDAIKAFEAATILQSAASHPKRSSSRSGAVKENCHENQRAQQVGDKARIHPAMAARL